MNPISRAELAAWADGEVTGARGDEIAATVLADPELQAEVAAHRALKARLASHFAPLAEAPVPDRLRALLEDHAHQPAEVTDLAAARARRRLPRWSWLAAPALAASLALAVFLPGGSGSLADSDPALVAALDGQLVTSQPGDADTRILLSFRDAAGDYCRAFDQGARAGIACREQGGWALRVEMDGTGRAGGEYQQAGAAEVLAAAQDMAVGPALTSGEEEAARAAGWQ